MFKISDLAPGQDSETSEDTRCGAVGEIPAKEAKRREYFRKTVVNKGVSNATESEKKKICKCSCG